MLFQLSKSRVRADFTNGNHNAVKLTKEQLGLVDDFSKTVTGRKLTDPEYEKNVTASSEQLLNLLEGKATKKTGKTNFKDLKDLFDSIKACGYFQTERPEDEEKKHGKGRKDNSSAPSPSATNGEERVKKDEVAAKVEPAKEPEPVVKEITPEPQPVPQPQQFEHPQQPQQQQPPLQREAFNHHHEQLQQQHEQIHPPQQSQIDFFQESEIDLNAPHMDPAVVVVHQHPPPQHVMMMQQQQQAASAIPTQTFTNQMYIPPTTLAALQQQHHEHLMTFATQQQQQQPMPQQQPDHPQHFEYQHDEDLAKRMGQVGIFPEADGVEAAKEPTFDQRSPPQQPQDTMANIDEWENDQAGNATGNGNEEFNRTGSWRGRGRGRGGSGGPRGERRGKLQPLTHTHFITFRVYLTATLNCWIPLVLILVLFIPKRSCVDEFTTCSKSQRIFSSNSYFLCGVQLSPCSLKQASCRRLEVH